MNNAGCSMLLRCAAFGNSAQLRIQQTLTELLSSHQRRRLIGRTDDDQGRKTGRTCRSASKVFTEPIAKQQAL
jgi:hypothetical protein